jgi:tetratricopeptide (TPR) repeat protein
MASNRTNEDNGIRATAEASLLQGVFWGGFTSCLLSRHVSEFGLQPWRISLLTGFCCIGIGLSGLIPSLNERLRRGLSITFLAAALSAPIIEIQSPLLAIGALLHGGARPTKPAALAALVSFSSILIHPMLPLVFAVLGCFAPPALLKPKAETTSPFWGIQAGVCAVFGWVVSRSVVDPSLLGLQCYWLGAFFGLSVVPAVLPREFRALFRYLSIAVILAFFGLYPSSSTDLLSQGSSPIFTMLGIGASIGGMFAFSQPAASSGTKFSWIGAGLLLSTAINSDLQFPWWIAAISFCEMVWASSTLSRYAALATAIFWSAFGYQNWNPNWSTWTADTGIPGSDANLSAISTTHWDMASSFGLAEDPDRMSFNVNKEHYFRVHAQSARISTFGRGATAERRAGLISSLLSPEVAQTTIFGDLAGNVLTGLRALHNGPVTITTPSPQLIRRMAQISQPRRMLWLDPFVLLRPIHPNQALSESVPQDLIIEISHAPWGDSFQSRTDERHFKAIKKSLHKDGVYALLIHLAQWPELAPSRVAHLIGEHFVHMQLWLPPKGADSLLITASDQPFSWRDFKESAQKLQNARPLELASHAIAGGESIEPWPQNNKKEWPIDAPLRPILHLSTLSTYTADSAAIWTETGDDASKLDRGIRTKVRFLELLGRAAKGNMEEVFEAANDLIASSNDPAEALSPLIAPHLRDAKSHIDIARREGQGSKEWENAGRFATTARMLSPSSLEPILLQAEIAIGQGHLETARQRFEDALELNDTLLPALDGMARIEGLQDRPEEVEVWLRRAIKGNPQNWRTHHNLGLHLHRMERSQEGEKLLRRAVSLSNSEESEPRLALASLYLDSGESTRGLLESEKALSIEPNAMGWFIRGRAHFQLDAYEKAEEDFRRATLSDPDMHAARGAIGNVRIALGDLEGAAQAFRSALRFDPNNSAARENLLQVEQELGRQQNDSIRRDQSP